MISSVTACSERATFSCRCVHSSPFLRAGPKARSSRGLWNGWITGAAVVPRHVDPALGMREIVEIQLERVALRVNDLAEQVGELRLAVGASPMTLYSSP